MAGALYDGGRGLPHEVAQDAPEAAWVERADGERIDLVLQPGEVPGEWVASPPEGVSQIMVRRGDQLRTQQYPGQSVRFDRVWSAAGDALVIQQED
jgi:hypothetical protein